MCPIGAKIFLGTTDVDYPNTGPCPALETQDDGKRICGVIKNPARYAWKLTIIHGADKVSAALAHLVGAGQGCDAHIEGEPYNHEFYHHMTRDLDSKKSVKARRLWEV